MATSRASLDPVSQSFPSADQFAEVLSQAPSWYNVSVFLGAPMKDLDTIRDQYSRTPEATLTCLIEVYKCMDREGKLLSWESIATALRRMRNHSLAEKIHEQYVKPSIEQEQRTNNPVAHSFSPSHLSTVSPTASTNNQTPLQHYSSSTTDVAVETSVPVVHTDHDPPTPVSQVQDESMVVSQSSDEPHPFVLIKSTEHKPVSMIAKEYETLFMKFDAILLKVKRAVKNENIDLDEIQDVLRRQCGLPPLPQEKSTLETVFTRVEEQCSILNFLVLEFIVKNLLNHGKTFTKQLTALKRSVERFKSSANMVELVTLIKSKQTTPTKGQKQVKLKVREYWNAFSYKQFETIINEIFNDDHYDIMTNITVTKGCICLNWIIPDIDTTKLLPQLPLEFVRLIGVIHLHIGSEVIYNIEGDGCETIEAAMLQAIELKNTRAIELLLAVGCSPQVATYNDSNTVTNIVNIRATESKESSSDDSSGGVDHVCILGHNEHMEAIVDPSREPECSSCSVKEKMIKQLHQEMAKLHNNTETLITDSSNERNEPECSSCSMKEEMIKQLLDENARLCENSPTMHMQKIQELASEIELYKERELNFAEEMKLKASEIELLKEKEAKFIKEMLKELSDECIVLKPEESSDTSSLLSKVVSYIDDSNTVKEFDKVGVAFESPQSVMEQGKTEAVTIESPTRASLEEIKLNTAATVQTQKETPAKLTFGIGWILDKYYQLFPLRCCVLLLHSYDENKRKHVAHVIVTKDKGDLIKKTAKNSMKVDDDDLQPQHFLLSSSELSITYETKSDDCHWEIQPYRIPSKISRSDIEDYDDPQSETEATPPWLNYRIIINKGCPNSLALPFTFEGASNPFQMSLYVEIPVIDSPVVATDGVSDYDGQTPPLPTKSSHDYLNHYEVYRLMEPLKVQWAELGMKLRVSHTEIEAIDREKPTHEQKLMKMLSVWLRRRRKDQPIPSWKILHDAVETLDRNIADAIAEEHPIIDQHPDMLEDGHDEMSEEYDEVTLSILDQEPSLKLFMKHIGMKDTIKNGFEDFGKSLGFTEDELIGITKHETKSGRILAIYDAWEKKHINRDEFTWRSLFKNLHKMNKSIKRDIKEWREDVIEEIKSEQMAV